MKYEEIQRLRKSGIPDSDLMRDLASQDAGFAEIVTKYQSMYPNPDPFLEVKAPTYLINKYYSPGKTFTTSKATPLSKKTAETVSQMSVEQKEKTSVWQSLGKGIATVYDYAKAPTDALTGLATQGLASMTGRRLDDEAQAELDKDIDRAPTAIRTGVPLLAGIATGGLSIPASMAWSGGAGAGSSLVASVVEAGSGKDVTGSDALIDSVATGATSAAVDGLTMGLAKPVTSLLRAKGLMKPAGEVVQGLVQPKATQKLIQETAQTAPDLVKKPGLLRKGSLLPSVQEKELGQTAKTIAGFGKTADPINNMKIVNQSIKTEATALRTSLKSSDAALPRQQIGGALKAAQSEAVEAFGNEKTAVSQYQGILNIWNKVSQKFPGTTSGQWDARIAFDDELERQFGKKVFDATLERPIHAAVRTVRETVNNEIETAAKGAGRSFLPEITRIRQMYEILENLSTKVGTDTLKSGLRKALDTRSGKAAVTGAVGAAGLGLYDLSQ